MIEKKLTELGLSKLERAQTMLAMVNSLQFGAVISLLCATSVPGYCIGGSGMRALGLILPLISDFAVHNIMRFQPGRHVDRVTASVKYTTYAILLSFLSSLVMFGLLQYELMQGKSDFYVEATPYLVMSMFMTAVMMTCDVATLGCLRSYAKELLSVPDDVKTPKKND